jgi:YbbR domain-containing protein
MKNKIFNNMGLKVSAVLISVLLWFFVTSRGQTEMSIQVPLEFKDVPAGLGIVNTSAKSVNVTIKGQERIMRSMKPGDIRVFVDLAKARKGEGSFHVNNDDIKLPYAMAVMNVDPSMVRVKMEEAISKTVAVRPVLMGVPERGFEIRAVEVVPKSMVIQGLRSEVRKVNEIKTEAMDISGIDVTTTQELNVDTGDANIKTDKERVAVTVVVTGGKK